MLKKTQIFYEIFTSRFGYGKGFWTLLTGMVVAFALLLQLDARRPRPVVERIPASEVSAKNKTN